MREKHRGGLKEKNSRSFVTNIPEPLLNPTYLTLVDHGRYVFKIQRDPVLTRTFFLLLCLLNALDSPLLLPLCLSLNFLLEER